ncbi:hypothetical protein L211DRAFT_854592 [Terfezia boudieri ATCC MYA-4762]|uniref:Uncharacterized protein n=1 Tax=Terfezia boudieri ATCC MYA-4762 TaxID=1051890 RepID=A0A3N4L962_9PEZI|nr:hypothetical protein L211DRAFT_854592 [Terfezia boudieri ATCC MYA-4762]
MVGTAIPFDSYRAYEKDPKACHNHLVGAGFHRDCLDKELIALKDHPTDPIDLLSNARGKESFRKPLAAYIVRVAAASLITVPPSILLTGETGAALFWYIYSWRKKNRTVRPTVEPAGRNREAGNSTGRPGQPGRPNQADDEIRQRLREVENQLAAAVISFDVRQNAQASFINEVKERQDLQEARVDEIAKVQETQQVEIQEIQKEQGLQGSGVTAMMSVIAEHTAGLGALQTSNSTLQASIIDQQYGDLLRSRNFNDSLTVRLRIRPEATSGIRLAVKKTAQAGGRLTHVVIGGVFKALIDGYILTEEASTIAPELLALPDDHAQLTQFFIFLGPSNSGKSNLFTAMYNYGRGKLGMEITRMRAKKRLHPIGTQVARLF